MSKKRHRRIWLEQELNNSAASMTGVTGLTPSLPMDGHEWENYKDIETLGSDVIPDGHETVDE